MKQGYRSGKLVTVNKIEKAKTKPFKSAKWLCKCDCGNEKVTLETSLYNKCIKSCGCHEYKNKSFLNDVNYLNIMKNKLKSRSNVNSLGCWQWMGAKRNDYGNIVFNGKTNFVHRVSWELFRGKIPLGIKVCHHCDNPSCCNPDHLFLGTQKENVHDGIFKGRYIDRPMGKRRSVLTYEQVQEVKKLHEEGLSRKELMIRFKVSQTCIAKILTGKSWKINWDKES